MIPRLDLHVHSQFSPCANDVSIERDVETALAKGVRVIAITDHGTVPFPPWFENYLREVEWAQKKVEGRLTLLKGMEVDIVEGGRLAVSASL
ncbi:MAG: PHP domain-containing protein, partial [Thermofilaceae archaeon]